MHTLEPEQQLHKNVPVANVLIIVTVTEQCEESRNGKYFRYRRHSHYRENIAPGSLQGSKGNKLPIWTKHEFQN